MIPDYSDIEIQSSVNYCLEILFKKDSFLLEKGVHERTVAHKLAEYLQKKFHGLNVDCEYNLKGFGVKTLDGINECSEQKKTDRVIPDIIIHKRKTDDNLLVIEIKCDEDDPCDIEKLKKFTSLSSNFRYKLGLFIKFNSTRKPSLKWFSDGREITQLKPN